MQSVIDFYYIYIVSYFKLYLFAFSLNNSNESTGAQDKIVKVQIHDYHPRAAIVTIES